MLSGSKLSNRAPGSSALYGRLSLRLNWSGSVASRIWTSLISCVDNSLEQFVSEGNHRPERLMLMVPGLVGRARIRFSWLIQVLHCVDDDKCPRNTATRSSSFAFWNFEWALSVLMSTAGMSSSFFNLCSGLTEITFMFNDFLYRITGTLNYLSIKFCLFFVSILLKYLVKKGTSCSSTVWIKMKLIPNLLVL